MEYFTIFLTIRCVFFLKLIRSAVSHSALGLADDCLILAALNAYDFIL